MFWKNIYRRGLKNLLKPFKPYGPALKVIKLLRNLFVLKAGLNFRIFLRLKVHVLRAGRSSWSLFCSFCKTFLNSLSTSSWRRSESLVRPDSTKASLYEQRGKMMRIARFFSMGVARSGLWAPERVKEDDWKQERTSLRGLTMIAPELLHLPRALH